MLTFNQPKLEIVQCDNGYVVEWRDERRGGSSFGSIPELPTSGVKIFTSKKALSDFIEKFFTGNLG